MQKASKEKRHLNLKFLAYCKQSRRLWVCENL